MSSLFKVGDILQSRNRSLVTGIWPVWKDSIRAEVIFQRITKRDALRIWHTARRWERTTHDKGKHGGIIGRTAMAVLHALIFDFLNYRTGRLDPSIQGLAYKAGCCARSVHTALQRIRSLGLITWQRRCSQDHDETGRFRLAQLTNAYGLQPISDWAPRQLQDGADPTTDTLGYPTPHPSPLQAAEAALKTGSPHQALCELTSDPRDPLAQALAELGMLMGALPRTATPAK